MPKQNPLYLTTNSDDLIPTSSRDGDIVVSQSQELIERYQEIHNEKRLSWTTHLKLLRKLGAGGQGVVYLTERRGADGFTLPVALKIFSPERYPTPSHYDADMGRMGRVAARVARIQHDNLLLVENFLDRDRIRMMVMERVEGFDLRRLLTPKMYGLTEARVSNNRWLDLNRVVVTAGPEQPRLKAGIAVQIVRECLEALAAIHREGIIHGDIKPANIMLKRTGHSKIIDIGTAFDVSDPPQRRTCTPAYAAPEVLSGSENTARSDLASLGYVTIELLAGRQIFGGISGFSDLMRAKETLPQRLHEVLPEEVSCNSLLMSFLKGLVAPNPKQRFASAEHADLVDQGAAAFHRQLVKSDLASEYENDIRLWIDELFEMDSDGLLQFEIE